MLLLHCILFTPCFPNSSPRQLRYGGLGVHGYLGNSTLTFEKLREILYQL